MAPMLATRAPVGLSYPPATSTFPLGSNVAVKLIKGVSRPAATVQTWLTGSYSSALSRILPPVQPPRTRTLPSANPIAVAYIRPSLSLPVAYHCPAAGSSSSQVSKVGGGRAAFVYQPAQH